MVSAGDNSRWDAQGRLGGDVGGGAYDVRFGYSHPSSEQDVWTLSGAFKFSQGTSIALAYGENDVDTLQNANYFYGKLGHDWGNNSVAIDYKTSDDTVTSTACNGGTCDGETFGVGFVHTMPKPKVDLYVGYRHWELDDFIGGSDDVDVFFVGSRVKFD
jgi:hypothetical protein